MKRKTSLLEFRRKIRNKLAEIKISKLTKKYRNFSMIPENVFKDNLKLCYELRFRKGCIVECGVWKGGMSAAMIELMGTDRDIYLFDSFEGLPPATEDDGLTAIEHQKNITGTDYFDNCTAEISYAKTAMTMANAQNSHLIKGWFSDTLSGFHFKSEIIILRLDGDWYDSTMQCLDNLYDKVTPGGLIIIDDYHFWDGCTKAVHDFVSKRKIPIRIKETKNGVCYFYKY